MAKVGTIRIGMLGFGTVGTGTYRMLADNRQAITEKIGMPLEVVRIGVRDMGKERGAPRELFTTNLESIIDDPEIDVVLELMGGLEPAAALVERAIARDKHVVTANKEMMAKHGSRLVTLARDRGLDLHYEAAVGGGIPLVQPLKHQLAGNDVLKMMGILNGTTNYILTKMAEDGADLADALGEAQAQGFAEADPTNDVDGFDTMYKISILASIAFGKQVPVESVHREGIRSVTKRDMQAALDLGYRIRLLGIVEPVTDGRILARVHPTLIPMAHPLANVNGVYNALWLHGDFVGDLMFSGRGAGSDPTASAVMGDLIDVGRNLKIGGAGSAIPYGADMPMAPMDDLQTRYFIRLIGRDRPKGLGEIALAFGNHGISLSAMHMNPVEGETAEIIFLTHRAKESDVQRTLDTLRGPELNVAVAQCLRVEGEGD